ncbi:hypothetical protein K474DRAFT_1664351 [Panus rudis PR-1116 ss-1]|nr:hypothetical protein K474DRAFT_1664351 [Panus rudis PR-1116 ss-1]
MPIAPITGKLRKRFWLDLTTALGLGVTAGYAFWYGIHLKHGERTFCGTYPASVLKGEY